MRRKVWSARDLGEASATAPVQGGGEGETISAGGEGSPEYGGEGGPPGNAAGGEGSGGASDIRLKDQIEQIGQTKHDLPLYRFHYKGGTEEYAGVMAQDVLKVMPEAVSVDADGFYRVNYGMLGIQMIRLDGGRAHMATAGGEGSGSDQSDIRLKDRIQQIGTISIAIGGNN